ncbi:unnamed protein product [Pleuronectes platessa]|uniref:Cystatin domain-containing protein n=1 Tax=Pleuronectes platessa TaxID=8262 RepID=A0A9N7V1F2_PLEPL|nr:unnamed protein product [Pleuronectes platessa]
MVPHALPVNGTQVLAAAQFAVFEFNTVNAEQQFEVLNVTSANIHLVAGLDYILEVQLGSTKCTRSHRPTLGEPRDLSSFKASSTFQQSLSVERRNPSLSAPPPTNPWLAAIGGTQSGVLMLQLGEETLVNLPIACHRPWPGLFVSGTPLIGPSTPSSVFPPFSSNPVSLLQDGVILS